MGADLLDLDGGMECKLREGRLASVVHMSVLRRRTIAKPTSAHSASVLSDLTLPSRSSGDKFIGVTVLPGRFHQLVKEKNK